jgi:hypothetical protein
MGEGNAIVPGLTAVADVACVVAGCAGGVAACSSAATLPRPATQNNRITTAAINRRVRIVSSSLFGPLVHKYGYALLLTG